MLGLDGLVLTPTTAVAALVAGVLAGYRYRHVWRTEGPAWQAWLYGTIAAACLLALSFLPLKPN